jgi:hypothetical protein
VNRDFVLKREEKEEFVRLMRLYERFCEVICRRTPWFHREDQEGVRGPNVRLDKETHLLAYFPTEL